MTEVAYFLSKTFPARGEPYCEAHYKTEHDQWITLYHGPIDYGEYGFRWAKQMQAVIKHHAGIEITEELAMAIMELPGTGLRWTPSELSTAIEIVSQLSLL